VLQKNIQQHELMAMVTEMNHIHRLMFGGLMAFGMSCLVSLADEPLKLSLWENGAPGFEDRKDEPELAQSYWIRNIHNPSITVFLPPEDKANGAAVLVCPGGGHRELVFNAEGVEAAEFLNELGVAAFALKYRLGREQDSPYSTRTHSREDGARAMRLIRSRAAEWGIDPNRLGMMGFSAGGEVVSSVTYGDTKGREDAGDAVERLSARPNFQIMIYPGPMGIPDSIPDDAPPAFLLVANDDRGASRVVFSLLGKYREARRPIETHIFARGGHAFNMGNRSQLVTIKGWTQRVADWMADNNILDPKVPSEGAR
jgi:acetyl esterase/lipase